MRWLNRSLTIVIVFLLIITSFTVVLIIDGRNRQDPSEVVWEKDKFDDFNLYPRDTHMGDDVLYSPVNGGPGASRGNEMIAVDLGEEEVLWNHTFHEFKINSICSQEDVIYSGSFLGNVVAVEAETGEKQWNRSFDEGYFQLLSIHATGDLVHIAFNDGNIVTTDAETGEKLWSRRTHDSGAPSIFSDDGIVYSGSSEGNLTAIDSKTGDILWEITDLNIAVETLYENNGILYGGGTNGNVLAYEIQTQEKLWNHSYNSNSVSSIYANENQVYSGDSDSTVVGADIENGEKVWSHEYHNELADYDPEGISSIYVVEEKIYSFDYTRAIAVEHEGSLITGISRSLSAFGGVLSTYVISPLREYWLIFLIIGGFIGSGLALFIGEAKKKRNLEESR